MRIYLCGCSSNQCSGANINAPNSIGSGTKGHSSRVEAFRCYVRKLMADGYQRLGSREFSKDDGPILVLNKQSHFGGEMRMGKNEKGKGKRVVPAKSLSGLVY